MIKTFRPIIILFLVMYAAAAWGQAGSAVKVTPESEITDADSLKKADYVYLLPFLGERAQKRGFKLPYPSGIMVNSFIGTQDINISDLEVGFNGSQMFNLDSIVVFNNSKAHIQNVNARIDFWVLPFLNIYGLGGATWTQTDIHLTSPIDMSTTAKFDGYIFGVGATLASGVDRFFAALDYNATWSYFDGIEGAVNAQMLSLRGGYSIPFKNDRSLSFWIGGGHIFINRTTEGAINLGDIVPDFDGGKLEPIINSTKDDYPDMSAAQYAVMKKSAETLYNNLPAINSELDKTIVSYSLKKMATHKFSAVAGAQFQLNRRFIFRAEAGFLGGRTSLLLSANYRFGIIRQKYQ